MITPELSNGLQNKLEGYEFRLKRDFPNLTYSNFALMPNGTRIIIDDVGVQEDRLARMASVLCGETYIYSQSDLVRCLEEQLKVYFEASQRRRLACIFPGQGARSVLEMLNGKFLKGVEVVNIDIGRKFLPNGEVSRVETDTDEIVFETNPELVVVIDDVIASGATTSQVRKMCNVQDAEYIAAPLLMLSPVQNRYRQYQRGWGQADSAGVRGYNQIQTPLLYQGQSGITPVNSLSTLISDNEKGRAVRREYGRKYAGDIDEFELALQTLQI